MTVGSDRTPRRPTRRTYAWIAIAIMLFTIYASLIPFEFRFVPLETALDRFERVMLATGIERTSRSNFLANLLLFVPIGFGLAGAVLLDRRWRPALLVALLAVLPASLATSLTAEFLQIYAPERIVSRSDVEAQTLGCLAGIGCWVLAGTRLTGWLRTASDRSRGDRVARALSAYAAAWVFVNLAPFDLTVSLGVLSRRYDRGLISLVPFQEAATQPVRFAWDVLATTLAAIPLGALGLIGWTGLTARRHSRAAFLFGAAFVVLMEGAQVFVRSHSADVDDVLFGALGVGLGVWLVRRLFPERRAVPVIPRRSISIPAAAALVAWCVVVCLYHWMPFDFTADKELLRHKLAQISLIPFAGYRSGSELNVFNNLMAKIGLAVPVGVLAAFAVRAAPPRRGLHTAVWMLAAAAFFSGLEAGQLLLPQRTADPSDVLVSVAAVAGGLWVGRWLQPDAAAPRHPSCVRDARCN